MSIQVAPDRVAIYIRWSTEDQSQGHTLQIQLESCRFYTLSQGWQVNDQLIFIDDGYSGASLARPAMTRLRQAVSHGKVQCVVVYKLDRLSRNVKDLINLVLDEWSGTCCIRSALEPVDTASDVGKLFFTLLGSFADFERSTIKTRTWSGKRKNAERGLNPGIPYPYGYSRGEGATYAINPAEAAVVREIFDLYRRGFSCGRIAALLNERGPATRRGAGWSDAMIAKLLRNPIYMGRLMFAGVVVDGAVPPLVDRDLFDEVGRMASARPRPGRSGAPRTELPAFLLTGLARCICGHAITGYRSTKGARYYCCSGARAKGPAICQSGMIPADRLDRLVVHPVRHGSPFKSRLRQLVLAALSQPDQAGAGRVELLRKRLAEVEGSLTRIRREYMQQRLTPEAYSSLYGQSHDEHARLVEQLNAALAAQEVGGGRHLRLDKAEAALARLDDWDRLTPAERKQVLKALLAALSVRCDRSTGELAVNCTWRLPPPAGRSDG